MVITATTKLHAQNASRSAECDRPLASFGLTDRQDRFLVTAMRHSGVFVGRQYAAFAGITHGQKVHDFIEMLLVRRFAVDRARHDRTNEDLPCALRPLYAAIGEADNRHRRRVAIGRTIRRLMIPDAVVTDRSIIWLGSPLDTHRTSHRHAVRRASGLQ